MSLAPRKLRIGHMPYLNSEVFYRAMPPGYCELTTMPPRAMAAAVERGELDGGPLPVAEVMRMGEKVRAVGELGVACYGAALSVLLFSEVPSTELDNERIAVTAETATSVQLVRVLASDKWHVNPVLVGQGEPARARLVIGDDALEMKNRALWPYTYDLGEEWRSLTGLPFVFAVWAMRSDLSEVQIEEFETVLKDAYCEGRQMVNEIAASRANSYIAADQASAYIRHFTYTIGAAELNGIQEFRERLARLPEWRPESVSASV